MLAKVADFYEAEVDAMVESLTAALEPMLIVFLGGVVGFIVVVDVPAPGGDHHQNVAVVHAPVSCCITIACSALPSPVVGNVPPWRSRSRISTPCGLCNNGRRRIPVGRTCRNTSPGTPRRDVPYDRRWQRGTSKGIAAMHIHLRDLARFFRVGVGAGSRSRNCQSLITMLARTQSNGVPSGGPGRCAPRGGPTRR